MADRGILMSAPMVRALLREARQPGTGKTQTRRLFKLPTKTHSGGPIYERPDMGGWEATTHGGEGCFTWGKNREKLPVPEVAGLWHKTTGTCAVPSYRVGDRLWVKETWCHTGDHIFEIFQARMAGRWGVIFRADDNPKWPHAKWWPSIFMPREFSRLTLTVTDVRVERLQDISREDAIAEGLIHKPGVIEPDWWMLPEPLHQGSFLSPVAAYTWIWNSLHDKPGERWDDNPWIVAISFDVREGNIDRIGTTHD